MFECLKSLTADELIRMLPEDQIKHSLNVEILVGKLVDWLSASKAALPEDIFRYFSKAAYYHDIGKVCIPPNILNKSGALTEEEYTIIRRHPIYGQELLDFYCQSGTGGISSFLLPLTVQAAGYHHEWWNGEGYPFRLRGRNIPYVARVTSVCDAYDAMVSDRPYHKAHTHAYACEEVYKGSGTQFEPALVKVFLEHASEIPHILEKLRPYHADKPAAEKTSFMQPAKLR